MKDTIKKYTIPLIFFATMIIAGIIGTEFVMVDMMPRAICCFVLSGIFGIISFATTFFVYFED